MPYQEPHVIAEIGCNHMGDMGIAHELIKAAAHYCNVDGVKFQKRSNRELLSPAQYNAPHPNPANSFGGTYGEHREFLELDLDQHRQLKAWCEELGLVYSTSVWDLTSAQEIASLEPANIKIPSARNTDFEMLAWLCRNYAGEIQISVGMTTLEEEKAIVDLFVAEGRARDLVIFSCTSGYPVPFQDICLLEITRLIEMYGGTVKSIGFSGHHLGIAIDVAAYTLGAHVIERHYTLDRTLKGTDHSASLEPEGLRKLKRDLVAVHSALTYKPEQILEIETVQREKLKYQVPCR